MKVVLLAYSLSLTIQPPIVTEPFLIPSDLFSPRVLTVSLLVFVASLSPTFSLPAIPVR